MTYEDKQIVLEKKYIMVCFNDSDTYTDDMVHLINTKIDDILSGVFAKKSEFEL